jgi:hypothetical protein
MQTHSRAVVPQLVMPSRTVFPISRQIPDSPALLLLMAPFQPQARAENGVADSLGHLGQSRTGEWYRSRRLLPLRGRAL